jgi:hypothetical protein
MTVLLLVLPDGSVQPVVGQNATDGAPVMHLSAAPSATRRSFLAQQLYRAKQQVKHTVALVTAPGRGDRLVQAIYRQLPYHPERIESGTAWTVSLEQPLSLRPDSFAAEVGPGPSKGFLSQRVDAPALHERSRQLHAYLEETISSAKEKPGDTFDKSEDLDASAPVKVSPAPNVDCFPGIQRAKTCRASSTQREFTNKQCGRERHSKAVSSLDCGESRDPLEAIVVTRAGSEPPTAI